MVCMHAGRIVDARVWGVPFASIDQGKHECNVLQRFPVVMLIRVLAPTERSGTRGDEGTTTGRGL